MTQFTTKGRARIPDKEFAAAKVDHKETLERAKGREAAGYEHPGHYEKMKRYLKEHEQGHWG